MERLRIISFSDRNFADRREAGRLLGREMEEYRPDRPVVLGVPRGGVVVADEVAQWLGCELDIALARKIGAPANPELAIGAVSEDGQVFIDQDLARRVRASEDYLQDVQKRVVSEIHRRKDLFRAARPKLPLEGRVVILVDDGVATGATLRAALMAARLERPKRLLAALPVGPEETITRLAVLADETVCLRVPTFFQAVGQFYVDFDQTTDQQVLEILARYGQAEQAA